MVLNPPRRTFREPDRTGLRDVNAAARAQRLHAWGWSLAAGLPLGAGAGFMMGSILVGLLAGPVLIFGIVVGIATVSGRGASVLYMPSGVTTPRKREYSRARALEVRGDMEGAVREYEAAILEVPGDPEPFLRIARIHRDEMRKPESAVHWFRKAQRGVRLSPGEAIRVHRELAEIFLYVLKEPRRAAPELARLAEGYPATLDGKWAAGELALIKAEMAEERAAEQGNTGGDRPRPEDVIDP